MKNVDCFRCFQNHGSGCDTHGTIFNRFEMLNLFLTHFNIIRRAVLGFINIFIFKNIYFRNMFLEIIYFWFVLEIKILIKPKTDLIILLK